MTKRTAAAQIDQVEAPKPLANVNGHYVFDDTKLSWTITSNPKRPSGKAHQRFEAYLGKQTISEYLAAGGTLADLKYDNAKGYVTFTEVSSDK